MKNKIILYNTGILGFLFTVTSLLVVTEIRQKFNIEYPFIFFTSQIFILTILIFYSIYTLFQWNSISEKHSILFLLQSFISYLLMYVIAYSGYKYSFILIFIVGIIDIYYTRKRYSLIKYKR
ncbi:hypothetical protein [Gemella sp. zg-1178]|uniref:hypothetical protein n=1 Tax=Gemella sp. zg-1178 TaxID=2840372 RepID=UPI001C05B766|nr:hypothetical protein [Gemella sp. zg-1178]MBU0278948.1 hypothetical protein [Gemella sp. zg-1178]